MPPATPQPSNRYTYGLIRKSWVIFRKPAVWPLLSNSSENLHLCCQFENPISSHSQAIAFTNLGVNMLTLQQLPACMLLCRQVAWVKTGEEIGLLCLRTLAIWLLWCQLRLTLYITTKSTILAINAILSTLNCIKTCRLFETMQTFPSCQNLAQNTPHPNLFVVSLCLLYLFFA